MEKKRSLGVTIIGMSAMIIGLCGIYFLISGIQLYLKNGKLDKLNAIIVIGFSVLVMGMFFVGRDILKLKEKARQTILQISLLLVIIATFVSYCWSFLLMERLGKSILSWLIYFSFVFYLTRPKVKEQFK